MVNSPSIIEEKVFTMKIYIFRHGQTDWNAVNRIQGREDIPLNDNGRAQARETGRAVKGKIHPAYMLVSPLSRARETGEIIAGYIGVDKIYEEYNLIECSYGEMSGKIVPDIYGFVCPDEEPWEQASARFLSVLDKYVKLSTDDFAVVSHGGTINATLYAISGGKVGTGITKLKNAGITVLEYTDGVYTIDKFDIPASEF